jgi:uncharacterized protein (DUF1015 family)
MPGPLIKPFKGLLYNKQKINDDIAKIVCPPYDIIPNKSIYYQRHPLNAIRLEVPVGRPSMNKYVSGRKTQRDWIKQGVLAPDQEETIYVYEQDFEVDGVKYSRRGMIPLLKLDRKRILTHEETRKKAKQDRENLIGTLKTLTSLVISLYDDRDQIIEKVLAGSEKEKIYDFGDDLSIATRFYRMKNRGEMDELASLMEKKNIYIADGHHRLSVSFTLGLPYIAMYLCNMYSPGIVIMPYHRTVKLHRKRKINQLLSGTKYAFDATKVAFRGEGSVKEVMKRISSAKEPAYVLYAHDDPKNLYVLTQKKEFFTDKGIHASLRKLKVNVGHSGLLKKLIGVRDDEISFVKDPIEATSQVKKGERHAAFLVPPTTVDEVKEIAENGLYMPPKSTYFFPKILTGLVFYKYA